MSETLAFPGKYQINRAILYPSNVSEQKAAIEIRSFIVNMSIVESILNDSIRGSIRVIDRGGLLEGYPIRGEEMLYLDIVDALGIQQEYRVFVYKVDNLDITDSADGTEYNLYFVSHQRFIADQRRIITSFNEPVSDMAQQIFNRYMRSPTYGALAARGQDINKQIIVEPTDGPLKLIIPRLTPVQALKFLESRSYSSDSPTCSFRFFETTQSYFFATDEFMYRRAVSNNRIFPMSHGPNIPQDNEFFLERMSNLDTVRNIARVDTFDDLHGGTYRNKVVVLDIVNRVANVIEPGYDYSQERGRYFRGYQQDLDAADRHSDSFIQNVFTEENARWFIMVKDYVDEGVGQLRGEQYLPEIASNRLAYFKQLNSIKLHASGPGRLDITCGDFIRLDVPQFVHARQNREFNTQLSGIYMVETVSRVIKGEEYRNEYILMKRSWSEQAEPERAEYLEPGEPGVLVA